MSFSAMRQQAKQERTDKRYAEAVRHYERLWEQYPDACDQWVGWEYADCLYRVQDYAGALAVCRSVYKQASDFAHNRNLYGRCIYQLEMKASEVKNSQQFLKAAKAITELTVQDPYSPYVKTVFKVVEYYKKNNHFDDMIMWLQKLDAENLSRTCGRFTNSEGQERELASDWEKYHSLYVKALVMTKQYQAAIAACDQALTVITSFHNDNDIWFKWYMAKSYEALGDDQQALAILRDILRRRKEWFFYDALSKVYYSQNSYREAMLCAVKAALGAQQMLSTALLGRLAELFAREGQQEWAARQIELACALQLRKTTVLDNRLTDLARSYQVDVKNLQDANTLLRSLQQKWEQTINEMRILQCGEITKLILEGKAGFITGTDGNSYYFKSKNFSAKQGILSVGSKVQFYGEESFDRKKNQVSFEAVGIRLAEV